MTDAQLHILRHALGIQNNSITLHKIEDPDWPWRNCYSSAPGCDGFQDIQELVNSGHMEFGREVNGGFTQYWVTKAGIQEALRGIVVDE